MAWELIRSHLEGSLSSISSQWVFVCLFRLQATRQYCVLFKLSVFVMSGRQISLWSMSQSMGTWTCFMNSYYSFDANCLSVDLEKAIVILSLFLTQRITERLRLEGISGGHLVQSPTLLKQRHLELLSMSKERDSTTTLCTHTIKNYFLMFRKNILFHFFPTTSCPVTAYHWKELVSASLHPPFKYLLTREDC